MRTHHRALLALLAVMPLAAEDAAEDRQLAALLDTPVSSVSKRSESLLTAPQAVEVLSGEDIRASGAYRLVDALRLLQSVQVIELDNYATYVGLRGVMQDGQPRALQILIDGVPLYNAEFGAIDIDNIPLPLDLVDRIEVVRGPSSTLYGANAVAGVIAITTRTALAGVKGGVRYTEAVGDLRATRGSAWGLWGAGKFSVSAGYSGASLPGTDHITHYVGSTDIPLIPPGGSHQHNLFIRPQWSGDKTTLWASYGQGEKKTWSPLFPTPPIPPVPYEKFATKTAQAGWRQTWSGKLATELTYSRTAQYNYTGPDPMLSPTVNDPGFNGEYRYGDYLNQQVALQANWDVIPTLHAVLGADYRRYDTGAAPVFGFTTGFREHASGAFANLDWNATPHFTLSGGARWENETLGGSRVSPRLAMVWSPNDKTSLRAGYYDSTRSPQLGESRVHFNNLIGYSAPFYLVFEILPNNDLKPERIRSYEAGYRQALGPLTFDLTAFRMKFDDLITEQPYGTVIAFPYYIVQAQYRNLGSATNEGVELGITWRPVWGVALGYNGTWLSYTDDQTGQWQSYAPHTTNNYWVRVNREKIAFYFGYQHVGEVIAASLNVGGIPTFEDRKPLNRWHTSLTYKAGAGFTIGGYAWNAPQEFTPQGAGGPTRSSRWHDARKEVGLTLGWTH